MTMGGALGFVGRPVACGRGDERRREVSLAAQSAQSPSFAWA